MRETISGMWNFGWVDKYKAKLVMKCKLGAKDNNNKISLMIDIIKENLGKNHKNKNPLKGKRFFSSLETNLAM